MTHWSRFQTVALVTLRIVIGWHFLYEGLAKLTNPYWTSAGYLAESQGWFSGLFFDMATSPKVLTVVDYLNIWGLILIGKKTAERIILELKDKVGVTDTWQDAASGQVSSQAADAELALIALGYRLSVVVRDSDLHDPGRRSHGSNFVPVKVLGGDHAGRLRVCQEVLQFRTPVGRAHANHSGSEAYDAVVEHDPLRPIFTVKGNPIISLDPAVFQVGGHKTDRVVQFAVGKARIFENNGFFVGEIPGTLENYIGQVHSVIPLCDP